MGLRKAACREAVDAGAVVFSDGCGQGDGVEGPERLNRICEKRHRQFLAPHQRIKIDRHLGRIASIRKIKATHADFFRCVIDADEN